MQRILITLGISATAWAIFAGHTDLSWQVITLGICMLVWVTAAHVLARGLRGPIPYISAFLGFFFTMPLLGFAVLLVGSREKRAKEAAQRAAEAERLEWEATGATVAVI